jgi:cation transport ATPase
MMTMMMMMMTMMLMTVIVYRFDLMMFIFATPVQFVVGYRFYRAAFKASTNIIIIIIIININNNRIIIIIIFVIIVDMPVIRSARRWCNLWWATASIIIFVVIMMRMIFVDGDDDDDDDSSPWQGLLNCNLGMDFLVVLGTSAAYFYSVFVMLYRLSHPRFERPCTFETGATVITVVTLGKYLEAVAKGRTSQVRLASSSSSAAAAAAAAKSSSTSLCS